MAKRITKRLKKRISFYFPPDLLEKLDQYCEDLGLDRNTVIHCAVEEMLEDEGYLNNEQNIGQPAMLSQSISLEKMMEEVYEGKATYNDKRLNIKTPSMTEKKTIDKRTWISNKVKLIKDQLNKDAEKK